MYKTDEKVSLVAGSKDNKFIPQIGDIFLLNGEGKDGKDVRHTGIVIGYDEINDIVTVLEALGNDGNLDSSLNITTSDCEGQCHKNDGVCVGCVRTSRYKRDGEALSGREGNAWQGYLRYNFKKQ